MPKKNNNNNDPIKKIKKKTFIEKGMDFWFYDQSTVKILRFGIILVTILIWIFIPLLVVRLFWSAVVNKSAGALFLGVILTYSFFGILRALGNINKMLKGFKYEEKKLKN